MNTFMKYKVQFIAVLIAVFLFACQKGGEPVPYGQQNSNGDYDYSFSRLGDDNEDTSNADQSAVGSRTSKDDTNEDGGGVDIIGDDTNEEDDDIVGVASGAGFNGNGGNNSGSGSGADTPLSGGGK